MTKPQNSKMIPNPSRGSIRLPPLPGASATGAGGEEAAFSSQESWSQLASSHCRDQPQLGCLEQH